MSWIDDLNKECIDAINNTKWHPDRVITTLATAIARLSPEARKMQRVREQVKRRMEQDEYDSIIDDIHEILED